MLEAERRGSCEIASWLTGRKSMLWVGLVIVVCFLFIVYLAVTDKPN